MDDTQQSRASDAAATRKRRSSILKSQRAPRTPFSELEFNVATPTDASKSRRVSFSRRTGVAEFITNEATTTWKNFYEEHNKSMESSGNESDANASRQPVGHLGNRIFDQQFQEVEAVDYMSALCPGSHSFTQPLPTIDTTDCKLTAPQNDFDLSALTDLQSKLFGNDFTTPTMGEMSGRIDVNFSTVHKIGDDRDDLDEIQRDIERVSSHVVCHGPARDRQNMSEYIEVDLNMTHVAARDEESDMSITDTVHSPKVQDVSKTCSIDKKVNLNNDWVTDKENIVVNPYVAPRESVNFALNEVPDKVLVFDGKRLTIQSENSDKNYRQTLLPNLSETPQRKTIVLNVNDDLPNFVDDPQISRVDISGVAGIAESNPSSASSDLSNTSVDVPQKRLTILDNGNISITQVVPSTIITDGDRRKSVVYGDGDISVTQAVPAQIITNRRRTVTYDNETGNISITQAVPSNIIVNNVERRQTVVFDDDLGNVSITQAIPTNILPDARRRTVVYDDDEGNISITQAVSGMLIPTQEKRQTIIFDDGNISVTQVLPTNVIPKPARKRRTIHYEDDDGNISVTQAVPSNLILEKNNDKTAPEGGMTQTAPADNLSDETLRKVVYVCDTVNVSITQPVPTNIIQGYTEDFSVNDSLKQPEQVKEHKIVIDEGDISMTQAIPNVIIIEKHNEKRKTIVFGEEDGDISMTQALPLNVLLDKLDSASEQSSYRNLDGSQIGGLPKAAPMADVHVVQSSSKKTFVFEENNDGISVPEGIDANMERDCKSMIFSDVGNLSMSKPIPAEVVTAHVKSEAKPSNVSVQDNQDIFVYQAVTTHSALKLQQKRTEQGDLKTENPELAGSSDDKPTRVAEDVESKQSAESVKEVTNTDRQSFIKDVMLIEDVKSETPKTSVTSMDVDDADDKTEDYKDSENDKKSVLDGLLDMSTASTDGIEDKNLMVKVESKPSVVEAKNVPHMSSESLFYVTKDSDEESQTVPKIENAKEETPAIEYKEEHDIIPELKKRLSELKAASEDKKSSQKNRHYEKVISADLNISESGENFEKSKVNKSFKNANDTRELLDMLSHLTDKTVDEDEEKPAPAQVLPISNKTEAVDPRRLSFAPNRRSIVLSRENLLSDISMAQAALQKSHFELEDSDATVDVKDSPTEHSLLKKSVRMSTEVVKTLHFEDESISDSSIKSDAKMTPLKKTAFGETSYMRESKAKVIPTFLKDVSDGMKELMLDLVKPMADVLPFDAVGLDKGVKKSTSTCSTQIQANLVTSSQIDIESELYSNAESCYNISTKSPMVTVSNPSEKSFEDNENPFIPNHAHSRSPVPQIVPGEVLVFDHSNPLNNIHLGPTDYMCAHKYNPNRFDDQISDQISSDKIIDREYEIERVTMQYNVGRLSHAMEGDACSDNAISITQSNLGKTMSIDRCIDAKVLDVKDTEVNTLIAMKGNKELLEASSSLTLVDDAVTNGKFEADIDTKSSSVGSEKPDKRVSISPVHIIYQIDEQYPERLVVEEMATAKSKKRSYSPTSRDKHKHITSVDVTPRPSTKVAKLSNSPNIFKKVLDMNHASEHTLNLLAAGHDITAMDINRDERKTKKSPKKSKVKKANTSFTVQQLITDVTIDSINDKKVDEPKSDCSSADPKSQSDIGGCRSLDAVSSYASGNKINEMKDVYSGTTTQSSASPLRDASRIDWHPELINELSSKNLVTECESGVNVVAKIDMLPFMGSHECEWESSSVDTWTFRLLHARLRLSVRLAHRHDNAARTRVRADTCVQDLAVEVARQDKKNPVATLCVRFACEAMRYMCARLSRGGARAGDVPALLRRAAAVARVALRWGRAMQDARMHLAYTLDNDGCLALKVANIPLRSVWEVTMRVELVVEDARETPWPRAGDVRVARVVSDVRLRDADVRRALDSVPRDWGHAPRTVWKIFRFLKHKTRDDEMVLGM